MAARNPESGSSTGARLPTSGFILEVHRVCFAEHPLACLAFAAAAYAFIVLAFGPRLAISSNYFVLLPVLAAALSYGLPGGLIAGALGLPANLILFAVLGRPEFSPASKPIAELSGILVGAASGYLAEYFRQMQSEIALRVRSEESLRAALEDKKLLLLELNHRVNNNLNVIKSIIQLQKNRTEDPRFREAADRLLARVFTIARAHERMFGEYEPAKASLEEYLKDILAVYDAEADRGPRIEADIRTDGRSIRADTAVPLGIILNEAVSNAWKYGVGPDGGGIILVRFSPAGEAWVLEVQDEGPGFNPEKSRPGGLGLKILRSLAGRLGGTVSWFRENGTRFRLEFTESEQAGSAPGEVARP